MLAIKAPGVTPTYMISFRRGDMIIEELRAFFEQNDIDAALITSGIGSLDLCKMHTIAGTELPPPERYMALEGPIEVGSMQGSVAGGEPHIHIVAHDVANDVVYIGHLEEGSRCCYRVELGVIVLEGVKTVRVHDSETGLTDIMEAKD